MASEDALNFVIGVFVSLFASFMDALGLNILKLDHVKEGQKDSVSRRGDCGRPLWHIGLYTYVASQLIGSTIALNYLKTQWVAPLGSVALIYNFIFAKLLVGTEITRKDVFGTLVVVASVIWIVVFGGMYIGEDPEASISLENLKTLFTRPIFIIYFSALNIITLSGLILAIWCRWAISDGLKRPLFIGMSPKKMRRIVGLMFSLDGGLLASETLLLAKSGVKLFTLSVSSQVNQFTDNTSRFIILALVLSAVLQVYCLNTALKLYSSVVVVPVFYGTYTALGLVNTIIYLDEIGNYPGWAISLVFAGIGVLIYGVYLLSSKPDPTCQYNDRQHVDNAIQQQVVVIVPAEQQEMFAISSPNSSETSSPIKSHKSHPPLYSTTTTTTTPPPPADDEDGEKILYSSTRKTAPPTVYNENSQQQRQQLEHKQQPFASASPIDEAMHHQNGPGHHHQSSSSHHHIIGSNWIRRLLSKTPWRSIQRSKDTFLSLHSTETGGVGSSTVPVAAIPVAANSESSSTTPIHAPSDKDALSHSRRSQHPSIAPLPNDVEKRT
ncbi:hypothetical protein BCR42DRAFT_417679 [Absidia repens]|uniref:Magnesium transporter NIPA-domain-containing protein n=1 Tax=Absidia repens TaxID=90262 RepID=A0A1X2IE37_9FUNG|nr:hypothetical protein BCR42DRAFT_417679 [Absidia repens]